MSKKTKRSRRKLALDIETRGFDWPFEGHFHVGGFVSGDHHFGDDIPCLVGVENRQMLAYASGGKCDPVKIIVIQSGDTLHEHPDAVVDHKGKLYEVDYKLSSEILREAMRAANIAPQIIVAKPDEDDDDQLPSYSEPGRILFSFAPVSNERSEVEVIDLDSDKAPFWLKEGGFLDYWIEENVDLELEGYYVIEGVVGRSWRTFEGDYDEEWTFTSCRRATAEEIATEALS